jgi:hypothetical protein
VATTLAQDDLDSPEDRGQISANNKLGVLKRIAYGFVNADNFAARALLWCPPVTS